MNGPISMKESLVIFTEGARVNFSVYGHLVPIFAGVLDGEPQIFGVVWEDVVQKEAFAKKVQQWIAENRLKEYIMVVEAWAVNVPEGDLYAVQDWLRQHRTLESYPDRHEIVTVMYCSAQEEIEYTATINRGIIPPLLGEWNVSQRKVRFNHQDFSTRFQGLFLKGKAGQN
jgi:hypothetical protein